MAFYPIWVFSLKIGILIGEHCYTDFNVKNKLKLIILAQSLNVVYDVTLSITSVSTPPLNVEFLNVHAKFRLV